MSRIGNLPIELNDSLQITIGKDSLSIKGSKGTLDVVIPSGISVEQKENTLIVSRVNDEKPVKSKHGLVRALIFNAIEGVTKGYEKKLEVNGVGYKVNLNGKTLKMSLGFSHEVEFVSPEEVDLQVDGNVITVSGIDKQQVGQVAAKIRELRKPEPYKGKGIKYVDEYIIRKAGKSASSGKEG